jgi:hypothetical protein
VGALGGRGTLLWSGIATVVLAVAGAIAWRERTQAPTGQLLDRHST